MDPIIVIPDLITSQNVDATTVAAPIPCITPEMIKCAPSEDVHSTLQFNPHTYSFNRSISDLCNFRRTLERYQAMEDPNPERNNVRWAHIGHHILESATPISDNTEEIDQLYEVLRAQYDSIPTESQRPNNCLSWPYKLYKHIQVSEIPATATT